MSDLSKSEGGLSLGGLMKSEYTSNIHRTPVIGLKKKKVVRVERCPGSKKRVSWDQITTTGKFRCPVCNAHLWACLPDTDDPKSKGIATVPKHEPKKEKRPCRPRQHEGSGYAFICEECGTDAWSPSLFYSQPRRFCDACLKQRRRLKQRRCYVLRQKRRNRSWCNSCKQILPAKSTKSESEIAGSGD